MTEKLLYRPEEAADALSIGRSAFYRAMNRGEIESIRIGRSRRIPAAALVAYVERLREAGKQ